MTEAVSVGEIVTRLRTEADDSGDVWFAIAADVTNNTQDPVEIRLELQAVDRDGFEWNARARDLGTGHEPQGAPFAQ
jgi:hypothetical protein